MDMRDVVAVFFAIVIVLTLISLVSQDSQFKINTAIGIIIIIFSLFAIVSVWFSRNKSYHAY